MGGSLNNILNAKRWDKHGKEVSVNMLTNREAINQTFATREEAVDQRTSYSSNDKAGTFGQKRKNLFGN